MMLTQDQWFEKIKKFVPSCLFAQEDLAIATFQAIAALLAQTDQDAQDHFNATFLTRATTPILELEGEERNIVRLTEELDSSYVKRIQRITSQTDLANIKAAVDALLLVSGCVISEASKDSPYCNRKTYCNRDNYLTAFLNDFFTIITPKQTHSPYSFISRNCFCSRANFVGSYLLSQLNYSLIVTVVDSMKAFGVMYRIIESTRTVVN